MATESDKKVRIFVENVRDDKDGSMEIISVNGNRKSLKRGEYHDVDPAIAEAYQYTRALRKQEQDYIKNAKEKEEAKARADGAMAAR